MMVKIGFNGKKLIPLILITYICLALLFTLFPRPILLSTDPAEIELFFQTHTGPFYKVLYADSDKVAIGNYLLLTIPALLVKLGFARRSSALILVIFFGFSLLIELIQQVIPGRVSDPMDLFSNTLSAVIGLLLAYLFKFIWSPNQSKKGSK
jgi:glycopeptide antibiotics resistance protein